MSRRFIVLSLTGHRSMATAGGSSFLISTSPWDFSTLHLMKMNTSQILIVSILVCFGFSPRLHAVNPPPDGGYSGGNTAEGQNALFSLTTGSYNTAVGLYSLLSLSDTRFNTGVGAGTLFANTSDENTAIGAGALLNNTEGEEGQPLERSHSLTVHRRPKYGDWSLCSLYQHGRELQHRYR